MGKILPKQAQARHYIDIDDPAELENLAAELRSMRMMPGQEVIRDLDGVVAIRMKSNVSTQKYHTVLGERIKLPSSVDMKEQLIESVDAVSQI